MFATFTVITSGYGGRDRDHDEVDRMIDVGDGGVGRQTLDAVILRVDG
jgi:hypothetical protein